MVGDNVMVPASFYFIFFGDIVVEGEVVSTMLHGSSWGCFRIM